MCVCVCACVCVCHRGVCFLVKISLQRPTCKTTFPSLTQSQAISQAFRVLISFRSMRDTTFFHFLKLFFCTYLPVPLPWWSKDLRVDKHAGGGQSTSKSTCEVPAATLTAYLATDQHPACPNRGRLELWPRKWFLLGQNPWRWACWSIYSLVHVDRRRWRSHQLTSDLKRCLLFRKCLRWSSRKAVSTH